jgi:hypothetical protein
VDTDPYQKVTDPQHLEKKDSEDRIGTQYFKKRNTVIEQGLTQTGGLFKALGAPGEVGGQGPGQQGRPVRRQAAQPGNNALQPRNILRWAPDKMV